MSGLVLLTLAGLVIISTFFADRVWTIDSNSQALSSRTTVEGPRGVVSDTDALALPALEPAAWRNGAAWSLPQGQSIAAAYPQAVRLLPEAERIVPTAEVVPIAEVLQTSPEAGPPKIDPSLLVAHGDQYFARSDVVAARLLYSRAADSGSAMGAAALAASFDPIQLEQRGIRGVRADPAKALQWYRVAMKMGDATASAHAEALIERLRSAASHGDAEARAILDPAIR